MPTSLDITNTKKQHNINNKLKKLRPEEPDSISNMEIEDVNIIDIEKENIIIYKDLNLLILSKKRFG